MLVMLGTNIMSGNLEILPILHLNSYNCGLNMYFQVWISISTSVQFAIFQLILQWRISHWCALTVADKHNTIHASNLVAFYTNPWHSFSWSAKEEFSGSFPAQNYIEEQACKDSKCNSYQSLIHSPAADRGKSWKMLSHPKRKLTWSHKTNFRTEIKPNKFQLTWWHCATNSKLR